MSQPDDTPETDEVWLRKFINCAVFCPPPEECNKAQLMFGQILDDRNRLREELAKSEEKADKFKWQVRDTVVRAEKAEGDLEIICTCIRTGATPPHREWSSDTTRKTVLRLAELHEAKSELAANQQRVSEAEGKLPEHTAKTWSNIDCIPVTAYYTSDYEYLRDTAAALIADAKKDKDSAYYERNNLVAALARMFPSGIRRTDIPGWSNDWHGCCFIDLPTGQISYHYHDSHAHLFAGLPPYTTPWDGHDKDIVHKRLADLTADANRRVAELLDEYERRTKLLPCQHEIPERGCCTYNWQMAIINDLRKLAIEKAGKV